MGLAGQMNKNARARVRDVIPRIARRLVWDQDEEHISTPEIQGYQIPRAYRMDTPRIRPPYDGSNRGRQHVRRHDDSDGGHEAFRRPDRVTGGEPFRRPERNGVAQDAHQGRYARPDHNQRAWDPDITCAACKWRGHPASNCDMLAMALFLDKYISKTMSHADRDKLEIAWLQRWKEKLGNPSRMPRKVMRAYLDYMDISAETLDTQMDWECWPVDDNMEDFGFDVLSPSDM